MNKEPTKAPKFTDNWALVELYRWQYGCLPGDTNSGLTGMEPVKVDVALGKISKALLSADPNVERPSPYNVAIVLKYLSDTYDF